MISDNIFFVGVSGDDTKIVLLRPVKQQMSKAEALNLAAWLVALADDSAQHDQFRVLLKTIEDQ